MQYRHEKHEAITIRRSLGKARNELPGKGSERVFLMRIFWFMDYDMFGEKAREEDQLDSSPMETLIKNPNAITI